MGRPRAAKVFKVEASKTDTSISMPLKPPPRAKTWRSRQWSPTATAGLGLLLEEVEMIPNGKFAREK